MLERVVPGGVFTGLSFWAKSLRTVHRARSKSSTSTMGTVEAFAFSCGNNDSALRKSVAIDSTLVRIRLTQPSDAAELAQLYFALWPDSSVEAHRRELDALLEGKTPSTLPLMNLLAEISDGHLIGFLQASLRSHADGCDPSRPVGFIEGWYVSPEYRRQGIGCRLLAAAEDWARSVGCIEMASDTQIDNDTSKIVHQALGYDVVDRCVHFRKRL